MEGFEWRGPPKGMGKRVRRLKGSRNTALDERFLLLFATTVADS